MKKVFFAAVAACVISLGLISCAKEDPAKGVNVDEALPCRATISGTAYVNIYQDGNTYVEFAKAGTVLTLTATNESLLGYGYPGNYTVTTAVGENGAFSAAFPARTDGAAVTVTIASGEFLLENIYLGTATYASATFKATSVEVQIIRDNAYVRDLKFTSTTLTNSLQQDGWEKGSYVFSDIYYISNEIEQIESLPTFDVKIVVNRNQFVPARQSDLILSGTVTNGALTVELDAPAVAVNPSGITFTVSGAAMLDVTEYDYSNYPPDTVTHKAPYSISLTRSILGGATNEYKSVQMTRNY